MRARRCKWSASYLYLKRNKRSSIDMYRCSWTLTGWSGMKERFTLRCFGRVTFAGLKRNHGQWTKTIHFLPIFWCTYRFKNHDLYNKTTKRNTCFVPLIELLFSQWSKRCGHICQLELLWWDHIGTKLFQGWWMQCLRVDTGWRTWSIWEYSVQVQTLQCL